MLTMKTNLSYRSARLLTVFLFVTLAAAMLAAPPDFTPDELKALRAEATLMFEPLPDRMPGSENDTEARIALGKKLYFDTILSENRSQSCNTCHRLDENRAGVDNEPTSKGAFDKRGDRNSPTTLNAGFHLAQFWDGRAADLKEQAKGPVLNPVEMAMPAETVVVERLRADADYPALFAQAFPEATEPVNYDNMAEAIAAFERTLITRDRFDDYLKGDDHALSSLEKRGLRTVLDMGCTSCHNGPALGANSYHKSGLVNPYEFARDLGRYTVSNEEDDKFKFKVPTWRNVALTHPYFHDGKVPTLEEAIQRMGHMQVGLELTPEQISQVVAFLKSLSDKERG
jgi:cytochrome c peroxidase